MGPQLRLEAQITLCSTICHQSLSTRTMGLNQRVCDFAWSFVMRSAFSHLKNAQLSLLVSAESVWNCALPCYDSAFFQTYETKRKAPYDFSGNNRNSAIERQKPRPMIDIFWDTRSKVNRITNEHSIQFVRVRILYFSALSTDLPLHQVPSPHPYSMEGSAPGSSEVQTILRILRLLHNVETRFSSLTNSQTKAFQELRSAIHALHVETGNNEGMCCSIQIEKNIN